MKVRHSILIKSPLIKVWDVSVDVESYPKWAPTFDSIKLLDEKFELNSQCRVIQPGMQEAIWRVIEFKQKEMFSWETYLLGFSMLATHQLKEVDSETTENIISLEIKGFIAILLWLFIKKKMEQSLQFENEGLKKFCENNSF